MKTGRNKRKLSISPAFVTRFLQLVTERQFAEAERVYERLAEKVEKTEWNKGYLQALYGMLLVQKSNDDRYAFLLNLNFKDKNDLNRYCQEFLNHSKSGLHADYDRGFFSAWAECMRILLKTKTLEQQKLKT